MTEENEKPKEYRNFKYLGKRVPSKGKSEGVYSKGKNEGKSWKRFILMFDNGEYTKEMGVFDSIGVDSKSMQLSEMEEGTTYNIGWTPGEQGKSSATAFFIGKESEQKEQDTAQKPSESHSKPDLSNFSDFSSKYLNQVIASKMEPNAVHMIGSYVATKEKEKYAELITRCKEAVSSPKEEPKPEM